MNDRRLAQLVDERCVQATGHRWELTLDALEYILGGIARGLRMAGMRTDGEDENQRLVTPVEEAVAQLVEALDHERTYAHEAAQAFERAKGDLEEKAEAKAWLRYVHASMSFYRLFEFLLDPRIVAFRPQVLDRGLHSGLLKLKEALQELEAGREPELFKPLASKSKAVSPVEATFKGRCAAFVELLHRAGDSLPEAAERVARAVTKAGFVVPRGARDAPKAISAETLLQWRKNARNGRRHPAIALTYDRVVATITMHALSRQELRKLAASLLAGMAQERDPLKGWQVR